MWRHRVTCLPPKNASASWGGPGSLWLTIIVRQVSYINTYSHAKNRNDLRPVTLSKVPFPEVGFSTVAILGGGWLQSPASDGPPCVLCNQKCCFLFEVIIFKYWHILCGTTGHSVPLHRLYLTCVVISGPGLESNQDTKYLSVTTRNE